MEDMWAIRRALLFTPDQKRTVMLSEETIEGSQISGYYKEYCFANIMQSIHY